MKIEACANARQMNPHTIADAVPNALRQDKDGNIIFHLTSEKIDLSRGAVYDIFVIIKPEELDKIYRFSLKEPKPVAPDEPKLALRRL